MAIETCEFKNCSLMVRYNKVTLFLFWGGGGVPTCYVQKYMSGVHKINLTSVCWYWMF